MQEPHILFTVYYTKLKAFLNFVTIPSGPFNLIPKYRKHGNKEIKYQKDRPENYIIDFSK